MFDPGLSKRLAASSKTSQEDFFSHLFDIYSTKLEQYDCILSIKGHQYNFFFYIYIYF